jgi:hypothetical protein
LLCDTERRERLMQSASAASFRNRCNSLLFIAELQRAERSSDDPSIDGEA